MTLKDETGGYKWDISSHKRDTSQHTIPMANLKIRYKGYMTRHFARESKLKTMNHAGYRLHATSEQTERFDRSAPSGSTSGNGPAPAASSAWGRGRGARWFSFHRGSGRGGGR